MELRFSAHPAACLLHLEHAVLEIWQRHQHAGATLEGLDIARPERILITRPALEVLWVGNRGRSAAAAPGCHDGASRPPSRAQRPRLPYFGGQGRWCLGGGAPFCLLKRTPRPPPLPPFPSRAPRRCRCWLARCWLLRWWRNSAKRPSTPPGSEPRPSPPRSRPPPPPQEPSARMPGAGSGRGLASPPEARAVSGPASGASYAAARPAKSASRTASRPAPVPAPAPACDCRAASVRVPPAKGN